MPEKKWWSSPGPWAQWLERHVPGLQVRSPPHRWGVLWLSVDVSLLHQRFSLSPAPSLPLILSEKTIEKTSSGRINNDNKKEWWSKISSVIY